MAIRLERPNLRTPDMVGLNLPSEVSALVVAANERTAAGGFPVSEEAVGVVYRAYLQMLLDQLHNNIDSARVPPLKDVTPYIPSEIMEFIAQRAAEKHWGEPRVSYLHTSRMTGHDFGRIPVTFDVSTSLIVERGNDPGHPASMLSLNFDRRRNAFNSGSYYEYTYTSDEVQVLYLEVGRGGISTYPSSSYELYGQSAVLSFKSLGAEGNAVLAIAYPLPPNVKSLRDLGSLQQTVLHENATLLFLPSDPASQPALTFDDRGRLVASSGVLCPVLDRKLGKTTNFYADPSGYHPHNQEYLTKFLLHSPSLAGLMSINSKDNQIRIDPSLLLSPKQIPFAF